MICRSCYSGNIRPVLSLGNMPLANGFLSSAVDDEKKYPLDLVRCTDCSLLQITETVNRKEIFSDYKYYSSMSKTMLKSAADLVEETIRDYNLDSNSLVVEIASNDGYLLKNYVKAGIPVVGVEPCEAIAAVAIESGVNTIADYFTMETARKIGQADIVHANNVIAHVEDLNDFVGGISELLKPSGVAIIETPYVKDMIDNCEFDTIYHEHLCYYSIMSLITLFKQLFRRIDFQVSTWCIKSLLLGRVIYNVIKVLADTAIVCKDHSLRRCGITYNAFTLCFYSL